MSENPEVKKLKRELRETRAILKSLTDEVSQVLAGLDVIMPDAISFELKGKRIAMLANILDVENDRAMHFALGISFPEIGRRKSGAKRSVKAFFEKARN